VLLAWQVQQGVSVVPKSVNPARIAENFAAGEIELSTADLERIAGLDRGYRLIDGETLWVKPGGPWTLQTIWDEG
jgi:alcohol dehydrogenase (NADP+)